MVPINISDNLETEKGILHLQTDYRPGESYAVATLFNQGQVLAREKYPVPEPADEDIIKKWTLKKHREAVETISFIFKVDEKVRSMKHKKSLVSLGSLYLHWGFLREAIDVLESILQEHLDSVGVAGCLCEAYLRSGEPEKAITVLAPFFKMAPKAAFLWTKMGKVRLKLSQFKKAYDDFKRAIHISNEDSEAHLYMALCCLYMVQNQVIHEDISSAEEGMRRFSSHLVDGVKASAQLSRNDFEPLLQCLKKNDMQSAIAMMLDILRQVQMSEDPIFQHLFYLQFIYGTENKNSSIPDKYIPKMKTLVQNYPNRPDLRMFLGMGYVVQCRDLYQRALNEFHTALRLQKDFREYENQIEEADKLGEHFFQFIKMLFR